MINDIRGFTLVEFLVATVILMVGLLGMLQGVNLAMDKNVENLLRNEAIIVADERMMLKRGKQFDALSTITSNLSTQRNSRGIFKNYSILEVVSVATTDSGVPRSKEISINVTWKYRNNRNSHSASSFVSTTSK